MECTTCYVDHCITAPAQCATGAPGGWQRLWFLNRCDVQQFAFEAINGQPRARVQGIALRPGATLRTFAYYKRTGLMLDSAAVDENGFRWEHTARIPLVNRDAETMATLQQMVGAELVLIGLHRDGRYWVAGLGEEGFALTNWADTKGRQPADGAVMEVTLALTDTHPQTELLLNDGTLPPADLEARLALTANTLATWTQCGAGPEPPLMALVLSDGGGMAPTFTEGLPNVRLAKLTLSGPCPGPYTLTAVGGTLPAGIVPNLPLVVGLPEADILLESDGTAPAADYTLAVQATGPGCATSNAVTLNIKVVPA